MYIVFQFFSKESDIWLHYSFTSFLKTIWNFFGHNFISNHITIYSLWYLQSCTSTIINLNTPHISFNYFCITFLHLRQDAVPKLPWQLITLFTPAILSRLSIFWVYCLWSWFLVSNSLIKRCVSEGLKLPGYNRLANLKNGIGLWVNSWISNNPSGEDNSSPKSATGIYKIQIYYSLYHEYNKINQR